MDEVQTLMGMLRRLVEAESPSSEPKALAACADALEELCSDTLGTKPERIGLHLRWRRPGDAPVLILCHYDTVWPLGTLGDFPFSVDGAVVRGPGVFDMKAGIVQAIWAIGSVPENLGPITMLLTADEETGSQTSRPLIEEEARKARAVLVLEPAGDGGAVKVARKGFAMWKLQVQGRAAHPGLEPEKGVNAAIELAHQVLAIDQLARPQLGTTLTTTVVHAGTTGNVVPEAGWCMIDGRVWTEDEAERLQRELSSLVPVLPGARLTIEGDLMARPMERSSTEGLYQRLLSLGYQVGAVSVGGGSDGNLTAALNIPTLDGLGAIGGGAHGRDEHVVIETMPSQARMVAGLVESLLSNGMLPGQADQEG